MADVVQGANSEFWRAPASQPAEGVSATPALPEICSNCHSEFVVDAGFCHVCGTRRTSEPVVVRSTTWSRCLELAQALEFHHIKDKIGLPTPALVAFFAGLACLLAGILVGFVFSANTVLDWQAVQVWRIQWLLASAAAFLAGILLRKN